MKVTALFNRMIEYLITNKPHLWLTKFYIFIPLTLFLGLLYFYIGSSLPLVSDLTLAIIITTSLSIVIFILLLISQRFYFHPAFNRRQLSSIFVINYIYIFIFAFLVCLIPVMISLKIQAIDDDLIHRDLNKIRIGMLNSDYINLIKKGEKYLDSVQNNPHGEEFQRLTDIKTNKFINYEPGQFTDIHDSVYSTVYSDTSTNALDDDYIPRDSFRFNVFERTLNDMPFDTIQSIKKELNTILKRYGFSFFKNNSSDIYDSSTIKINNYFDLINEESLRLYENKNIFPSSESGLILFICIELFFLFNQFVFVVITRIDWNNFLFALFISSLLLGVFIYINAIILWNDAFLWFYIPLILLLIPFFLIRLKKQRQATFYQPDLLFTYFINIIILPLIAISIYSLITFVSESDDLISIWILNGMCLVANLTFNYFSNNRFNYFINKPKS